MAEDLPLGVGVGGVAGEGPRCLPRGAPPGWACWAHPCSPAMALGLQQLAGGLITHAVTHTPTVCLSQTESTELTGAPACRTACHHSTVEASGSSRCTVGQMYS